MKYFLTCQVSIIQVLGVLLESRYVDVGYPVRYCLIIVIELLPDEAGQNQNPCHFDPLLPRIVYVAWLFDLYIPI